MKAAMIQMWAGNQTCNHIFW